MSFIVDTRITDTAFAVFEGPLSHFYLKNDARFPWFILVPRLAEVSEIYHLPAQQQTILLQEVTGLSKIIAERLKPDKINVASLGNIVNQLHLHVVARFHGDPAWPHGVWQEATAKEVLVWQPEEAKSLINAINQALSAFFT